MLRKINNFKSCVENIKLVGETYNPIKLEQFKTEINSMSPSRMKKIRDNMFMQLTEHLGKRIDEFEKRFAKFVNI